MAFKRSQEQLARTAEMTGCLNDEFDLADQKRPPVDNTAVGESTLDWCAKQPKKLWSHTAKGRLLYFPRTEMILVPFEMTEGGHWNCVVVRGNRTYPRGSYHLSVGAAEVECAIPLDPAQAYETLPELTRPEGE